jgi:tRNA threonylcarbamoyl adenosine modification protein YjeE
MSFATTVPLADAAATERLAEDIAAILKPGDAVALVGDLGAGKTTLARALIRALADEPRLEVPSPTFTLVQSYDLPRFPVAHFDLYRVRGADEFDDLGFDDALRDGTALVEWPERAEGRLPAETLAVRLDMAGDGRAAVLSGSAEIWEERLTRSLAIRHLLAEAGLGEATRRHLQGDASARRFERARLGQTRAVVMDWPPRGIGPAVEDGLPYPVLAHIQTRAPAFVAIADTLVAHGFVAPVTLAADLDAGLIVMSDLGSTPVVDAGRPIAERYLAAARLLAELHGERWPEAIAVGAGTHVVPPYDARALLVEVDLFPLWYVPQTTNAALGTEEHAEFRALWRDAIGVLTSAEQSWVLRDFHSPNLLWQGDDPDLPVRRRLGLVDVQDTVVGPTAYDLAAIATDARVDMPGDLKAAMIDAYVSARGAGFDRAAFEAVFAVAAAQRATKVLGGFSRLARRDGKPTYLGHFPRMKRVLRQALLHPVLRPVRDWHERHMPL